MVGEVGAVHPKLEPAPVVAEAEAARQRQVERHGARTLDRVPSGVAILAGLGDREGQEIEELTRAGGVDGRAGCIGSSAANSAGPSCVREVAPQARGEWR